MNEVEEFLLVRCNLDVHTPVRHGEVVVLVGETLWVSRLDTSDEMLRGSYGC
jgi:hypothetical protein